VSTSHGCDGPPAGRYTTHVPAPEDIELVFPADGGCFGCSSTNAAGLQLRFRRRGDEIRASVTVADRFHGAPGVIHGGIVATLLDEVSCAAAVFLRDRRVVTGELNVRYTKPCPVEQSLEVTARVAEETTRYLVIEAQVRHGAELLARSTGKFFFWRQ
jgi:uncharacterized protein (TIGR00369 family)